MQNAHAAPNPRLPLPEGMVERVLACPAVRAEAVARGRAQVAQACCPLPEELAAALVGSFVDARRG